MRPSQPSSASLLQNSSVVPAGSSIIRRTNTEGDSFSRKLRAVCRRRSCSWLKPKSIPALVLWQAEDTLGQDVPLDLRSAAFDRVGPGPEERVVPVPPVDGPSGASGELAIRPQQILGEVLQRL